MKVVVYYTYGPIMYFLARRVAVDWTKDIAQAMVFANAASAQRSIRLRGGVPAGWTCWIQSVEILPVFTSTPSQRVT